MHENVGVLALLFPRPSRADIVSRGCALSLFYASIIPAPPLAPFNGAHTCLDLVAPTCTPCPGPPLRCLLCPCWLALVGLPLLTRHTVHTCSPLPPRPLPQPQLVPSSLAPAGYQPVTRLGLGVPSSPFPSLVPAVSVITCILHLHRKEQPERSPRCMATSQA